MALRLAAILIPLGLLPLAGTLWVNARERPGIERDFALLDEEMEGLQERSQGLGQQVAEQLGEERKRRLSAALASTSDAFRGVTDRWWTQLGLAFADPGVVKVFDEVAEERRHEHAAWERMQSQASVVVSSEGLALLALVHPQAERPPDHWILATESEDGRIEGLSTAPYRAPREDQPEWLKEVYARDWTELGASYYPRWIDDPVVDLDGNGPNGDRLGWCLVAVYPVRRLEDGRVTLTAPQGEKDVVALLITLMPFGSLNDVYAPLANETGDWKLVNEERPMVWGLSHKREREADSPPPDATEDIMTSSGPIQLRAWIDSRADQGTLRPIEAAASATAAAVSHVSKAVGRVSAREREVREALLHMLVAGLAAISLVSAFVIARVGRRLANVTQGLRAMRRGASFSVPTGARERGDEIDHLCVALHNSAEDVRKRDEELRAHAETLEARVEERTHDLEEAREAAEAAAEAKQDFLSNMTHELRTPLHGILNLAQLAQHKSDGEVRAHLEELGWCGDHLLALINDLLDFAKVERGAMLFEELPFELEALVRGPLTSLRLQAQKKRVEFSISIEPGLPPVLLGDEGRLRQVLLNLASNAVKFTEAGSVAIELKSDLQNAPSPTDDTLLPLLVTVTDTGPGIAEDRREAIFGSFAQESAATSRQHGGTGLGLAIAKAYIEGMGGRVGLDSELGQGSSFWFALSLPIASKASLLKMTNERPSVRVASGEPRTVLLVEDNPTNRRIASMVLESARHEVLQAEDGEEALEQLHAHADRMDLVLLDLEMPRLGGEEALIRWRKHERASALRHLPVVILTAHNDPERNRKLLQLGADAVLSKPFAPPELLDQVRAAARRRPADKV